MLSEQTSAPPSGPANPASRRADGALKKPTELRQWIEQLGGAPLEQLASLKEWQTRVEQLSLPPDVAFEMLEIWRTAQLGQLEAAAKPLGQLPFPLPLECWPQVETLLDHYEMGHRQYREVYVRLVDDTGVSTRMVIPGTSHALRTVIPLARALEYQSRAIRLRLWLRIQVTESCWNELALLAQHLRASTFLDTPLPGATGWVKEFTARSLFVYPLLLRLAEPQGLSPQQFLVVDRLARRWAAKVGFRIDHDGKLHESPHGPTVSLSPRLSVRLDSHRLDKRLRELLTDGLPISPLSRTQTKGLVDEPLMRCLLEQWCGRALPKRWLPSAQGSVKLRFGLPTVQHSKPDESTDIGLVPGAASTSYVYGRFEQNTVMRLALGNEATRSDPMQHFLANADGGAWVLDHGATAWIERYGAQSVTLGQLVSVRSTRQSGALARLGQIRALEQHRVSPGQSLRKQTLQVRLWDGPLQLVGLRMANEGFFADCFHLPQDPVHGPTLIASGVRLRSKGIAMLRLPEDDIRIEIGPCIERGPGWERLVYRRAQDPL